MGDRFPNQFRTIKQIKTNPGAPPRPPPLPTINSSNNHQYAHHPALLAVNQTVYIIHSSSVIDEDMLGQEIWGSISHDGGVTWAESHPILPAALLPNQTSVANFSYWCNEAIWQRAFEGLAILEVEDEVWAVGETSNFFCWGTIGSGTHGAGRVARQLSSGDGGVIGDPCWLDQNNWTTISGYPGTIYGTEYNMSFCEKVDEMNAILDAPATVPAYSAWLYNNELFSLESRYYMQENTNAVWFEGDEEGNAGYWQRFWRDITSTNNSEAVWSEITYDAEGKDWYPVLEEQYGNDVSVRQGLPLLTFTLRELELGIDFHQSLPFGFELCISVAGALKF